MQPVNDEQLILLYYGELDSREAETLRARLATDATLAERFSQLAVELDAVPELPVPERDEFYGRRVWARVDAALENEAARGSLADRWFSNLRWAGGALVIGMVALIAFQLGRHSQLPDENLLANAPVETSDQQAALLEASLVNYFGDAERLLTAVSNSETGAVDLEAEKEWAKVLLVANRLYRFAAEQAGQHRIALLLGDMEPVLIELANGAGQLTPEEYRVLRRSIAERDLLFKVRSTNISLKPQSTQL
ncbi:MAG TPA: hypothetical protein VF275_09955 [Gammaproteobacteria bacterium]